MTRWALALVFVMGCGTDSFDEGEGGNNNGNNGNNGNNDPIPAAQYCDPAADWDSASAAMEEEVLTLVNQHRSAGATCGGQSRPPVEPLSMDGALRCAARVHSLDMETRGYFSHTNPENEEPWDRMEYAGYNWRAAGENIASDDSAAGVVQRWMDSTGHCNNIMNGDFVHLGAGKSPAMWTQVFGAPR